MVKVYYLPVEKVDNTEKVAGSENIHNALLEATEDPNVRKLIQDTTAEEDVNLTAVALEVRDPTQEEIDKFNQLSVEGLAPPQSTHVSSIEAIDTAKARPARVKRMWRNKPYYYDCFVTETVKDQYLSGNIAVGDYALVHYDDIGEQLVVAKVFKSW